MRQNRSHEREKARLTERDNACLGRNRLINILVNAAVLLGFAKTIVDIFAENLLPEASR